jgi:hypothetical protein
VEVLGKNKEQGMAKSSTSKQFDSYPDDMESEMMHFGDFLMEKEEPQKKKTPKAGSGKHLFKYVAPDFDAPLENFKEYME